MDKNKFSRVHQEANDDFLVEDTPAEKEVVVEKKVEDPHVKQKRMLRKRLIKMIIIMFVSSALLVGFGLFWQNKTDLMAFVNALWLACALEFFLGWIIFVYNKNIFSPLIHGFKTLGLMFVGKKPKKSYYEYITGIQEAQVPSFYYIAIFLSALVLLIPAIIITIILM